MKLPKYELPEPHAAIAEALVFVMFFVCVAVWLPELTRWVYGH